LADYIGFDREFEIGFGKAVVWMLQEGESGLRVSYLVFTLRRLISGSRSNIRSSQSPSSSTMKCSVRLRNLSIVRLNLVSVEHGLHIIALAEQEGQLVTLRDYKSKLLEALELF
jgi:hypothetical protein